jgi:hypothetical protein
VSSLAPGPADALWSFLWGKRRSRRHPVELAVRLLAPHCAARARTADLSRHGALIRARTSDLTEAGAAAGADLADVGARLGEGFTLRFEAGVKAAAKLVRMAWRPQDPDDVYLGCDFDLPLDAEALARLGVSARDCPPEVGTTTPPAAQMAHVEDPRRPLTLRVLDDADAPLLAGPLAALEGHAIALRLVDVDPTAVVARLGGRANRLAVDLPSGAVWSSRAYLVAVRLVDGRGDAVEVVLTASPPPSRELLRCLCRRACVEAAAPGPSGASRAGRRSTPRGT